MTVSADHKKFTFITVQEFLLASIVTVTCHKSCVIFRWSGQMFTNTYISSKIIKALTDILPQHSKTRV